MAIAIGAGSIAVSHVNDSFFWIVVQMTGMNVKQGYQLHTLGSLVIATVAAATCWGLSPMPLWGGTLPVCLVELGTPIPNP